MTTSKIDDEPDQEKRIEKLRDEVRKLGGTFSTEVEMPADLEEEFLKRILEEPDRVDATTLWSALAWQRFGRSRPVAPTPA